jgi:alanine racemase
MLRQYTKRALRYFKPSSYQPLNRVELDRSRMLSNIAHIQRLHPQFEIIPVLKGNAYGHGITAVAEILRGSKCSLVAVDGYFEANKIRGISNRHILVMGHILASNIRLLDIKHCSFVIQDIEGLHAFGALRKPVRIHLELNTGMNRLGLRPDELPAYLNVLKGYPKVHLEGVMTHLADADNELDETRNIKQAALFDEQVAHIIAEGFNPKFIHIAQTAGSAKIKSRYANAIRLGIGAYGINPLLPHDPYYEDLQALQPVLELKSTIIKVLDLEKGDKVSYNYTFTAPRKMCIGVLPLGYYEGVPRELSNQGCVTYGNHELPILGRVCMDHTMIDLKDTSLGVNDEVTVISKNPSDPNSVLSLQTAHNLFSYATLTGISSSIRREIV